MALPAPPHLRRWLAPSLLTALAYVLAGKAALLLAIPPGFASPIYPSAGLALAAVLVYGRRALPGVALGAFAINAPLGALRELAQWTALIVPLVTALGAALQAALGAALVRWRLPGPLLLGEPRDVALFCALGAVLACTVNASLSTLALAAAGVVPAGARAFTWWTWWGGDTLGVLIGTPIALTLIGQPRADWAARRITLGVPLLVTTGLLVMATVLVARWDTQRSKNVFDGDAAAAGAALDAKLREALYALQAMHGLFIGSDDVSADEMRRVAEPWLAMPIQVQALGFAQRVARADQKRYEAAVSRQSGTPYRVFERPAVRPSDAPPADADLVAVRYIEPLAANAAALGVNSMSVPAAREAIQRTINSAQPAATSGFRLTQEAGDQRGVVIYRALYREPAQPGGTPTPAERAQAFRGVVFVTLRMQQSLVAAMRDAPAYLAWCLLEPLPAGASPAGAAGESTPTPKPALQRLAGPTGCEHTAPGALLQQRSITLGGQQWQLTLSAQQGQVPDAGYGNAWLFSTVGLLSAAMLAALLLTVTGRTRRIEAAVTERTADLQREVAERQRTESALRESEQRFRNIFDHAPIGIVFADLQGRVQDANPKLRELLGYGGPTPAAPMPADFTLADFTLDEDRADTERDLARLLRNELPEVQRRSRMRHHAGHTLWVRTSWSVLRAPSGQAERLVAVVEDITEHQKREEAEQGRQLAESANQAKNEFLSRMSHELRTPLNAMLGFAQLLDLDRRPAPATHQKGWIAQILKAGWHLLAMINDTLDLSRIDAGMMRLSPSPVALPPLVAHCVAMAGPAAAQRGITLTVQLDAGASTVLGDETRIKQVISNLLSNGVKYNQPGGSVVVSAGRSADQRIAIRVQDTGLGLSAAQQAELFQPFNRLGRELSSTEGTGIGLVISRRLAELMGGDLRVESASGQGATFVFTLPAATDDSAGPLPDQPAEDPALRYRHRRVHYIEDNETNVEVMRGMLAQRPQVTLAVSGLGLDGLVAIRMHRPDLILLDMHLPDVDGLELLHQLQRDPVCADIPVVVVSADATPARVEQVLAAGARHYLTKPVDMLGFFAVLDELLEAIDSRYS